MIKLNVVCNPVLRFENGVVTGEIHIDPESILSSMMTCLDLPFNGNLKSATKNLIVEMAIQHLKEDTPKYIILKDGVVTNYDSVEITMHQAMDLIDAYVSVLLPDETSRRRKKNIEDYKVFKELVYSCDNCNCLGDTSNICRFVKKKYEK